MVAVDVGAKANALRIAPANDITDGTYIGDIKFGEAEPNSAAILADTNALVVDAAAIEALAITIDADTSAMVTDLAAIEVLLGTIDTDTGNCATLLGTINTDTGNCATLLGTIDTDTSNMATSLGNLDNSVDGNYLNVNINIAGTDAAAGEGTISAQTQRVTLATDDDGVAHLATIAGDTTNIETAVQIMDDWDSGDMCKIKMSPDATRVQGICDNADTTTAREVVAAVASNYVYITSFIISVDTAGNYWLEDGDAAQITPKFYLAANGGVSWTSQGTTPFKTTTVNKAINVKGSASGNVGVMLTGYTSTT